MAKKSMWDFLDEEEVWSDEHQQLIEYFMQNTTEKIFRRMDLMNIKSNSIRRSIHGVVYNNANGHEGLVRFYFLNIARFIEMGLGHNFNVDQDLGREGVKWYNAHAPQLKSGDYRPLEQKIDGMTNAGVSVTQKVRKGPHAGEDRGQYHKARPFLMNTIRQEVRRVAERLATQLCYTHTVYMSQGLIATTALEDFDEQWRKNYQLLEEMRMSWGKGGIALRVKEAEFIR